MVSSKAQGRPGGLVRLLGPAVLLLLVTFGGCSPDSRDLAETAFANTDPTVGYVGEQACVPCHLQQATSYAETGMGRAFYPMSPEVAVEDFAENNTFVDRRTGLHYRMERRGDRFYQRQYRLDSRGEELAVDEYELSFAVGSNNHSRGYVFEREGKLFQAPVCWYPQDELWDFCPGFEMKNEHFGRELQISCLYCHNGRMEVKQGTRNAYHRPIPHGIGCERCHGPGELHVARWQGGETPTGEPDPTIVHPRRLPRRERLSICYQCHLADAMATERVMRPGRDLQDFRPGQRLDEYIVPFHYVDQTQYDFGLSAQADRMILSACYRESGGAMECLTCHDPHVSVYHEQRPADYFVRRCLGCHAGDDCTETAESRDATTPPDDCVVCHMRKAQPDDQRYTQFTDHWIRRDIDLADRDHREDFTIAPIDAEHFASLPEGERKFYYARANQLLSMDAYPEARIPMWREAERSFVEAIAAGYDTVDAWFYLGRIRRTLGMRSEAEEAFRRAHESDPGHHDAAFALGQMLLARDEVEGATEIFERMLELRPDDAMALAELGRAHTQDGRLDDARRCYERALEQTPWVSSLHMNLGMLLAAQDRFDEARTAAREAVRLNPDGIAEWEFYEKLMRAVDLPEEAAEASRVLRRLRRPAVARSR
jgi:tetratricopeptide (TPR) repeat protein